MCGYIGILSTDKIDTTKTETANRDIVCRGPDSKKSLLSNTEKFNNQNKKYNFNFIFNRLSIVDLSEFADQPMYSKDFNTMILFNGEIYNHISLRSELEANGVKFNTDHSDTEVILLGLSKYGLGFLDKVVGQFAITYFDLKNMILYLIRDRVGQKPLFYSTQNNTFSFGSNLKSVSKVSNSTNLSFESLGEYLSVGVVSSPNTVFQNIYKVEPGQIITIDLKKDLFELNKSNYWDISNFEDSQNFNVNEFNNLLLESINLRSDADVEVANFLSGGIDSTSLIKINHDNNIKTNTFSVGYKDSKFDESVWFNQVVNKYKTNHITKNISDNFSLNDVLNSIRIFDEPYADPSTVPSYLLSKEISKYYKVAVSGDGGDELFGGYTRTLNSLKQPNKAQDIYSKFFPFYPAILGTGSNIKKYSRNKQTSYTSYFQDEKLLNLLGIELVNDRFSELSQSLNNSYKSMQIFEYKFYLSEMMMLKVDRTSMASSLEVRSPFVDHRLIEYMISHDNSHVNKENPKSILKNTLKKDFSEQFLKRPKMGFVFDIQKWVYSNIDLIEDRILDGEIINTYNPKVVNLLKINKTRMNANRLWKMFFLEEYIRSCK